MSFYDGYLSQLIGRPGVVEGEAGRKTIGKVADFLISKPDETFPRIDGFVFKTPAGRRYSPMSSIENIDAGGAISLREVPVEEPVSEDST